MRFPARLNRDAVIFCVGIAGVCYEGFVQSGSHPTLLVFYGSMIGLPVFLDQKAEDFLKRKDPVKPVTEPTVVKPEPEPEPTGAGT